MQIEIKDLHKSYRNDHEILHGINTTINKGDIVCIIGPSGSGKSTLLRCINLLNTITSGDILFDGNSILTQDINKVRTKIGMVFQSFNLFNNLDVLNNLVIGQTKVLKINKEEAIKKAMKNLELVGMEEFIHANVNSLSGGQKQRIAIARTLCMEPEVILFDEPTSALDPEMVQEVLNVIKEVAKTGITMAIVTHEMAFAKDVSNRIIFMDKGQIIDERDTVSFFNNNDNPRVKEFLARFNNK